jgi:hypothetical protein
LRSIRGLAWALLAVAVVLCCPGPAAADRDDTDYLQARLDAGGDVFIPKLPGGECYRTRGLWISRSGTKVGSDGACIVYLGPGRRRLTSPDGDPIRANGIFVVNRSSMKSLPPDGVAISDLDLIVPVGTDGYGAIVSGTHVTVANLDIEGVPIDAITVTGRQNGLGYAGPVLIRNTIIRGARRNGISLVAARDATLDGNTITGVGLIGMTDPDLGPWAGIDVEPDLVTYPIERVLITRNTISGNGGSGVLLAFDTLAGRPWTATQVIVAGNALTFNGLESGPFLRGGVCLQGGQHDGQGLVRLLANEISGNGGYGLCSDATGFKMVLSMACNDVHDNSDGNSQWGPVYPATADRQDFAARARVGCG